MKWSERPREGGLRSVGTIYLNRPKIENVIFFVGNNCSGCHCERAVIHITSECFHCVRMFLGHGYDLFVKRSMNMRGVDVLQYDL